MEATLKSIGFTLEKDQPHISGERFLMAKNKQVLVGRRDVDALKVVIKITTNNEGREDIRREKAARDMLMSVPFASETINFPKEIYWGESNGYLIWAIEFIEQEKVFVEHSLEEQFFLILGAFESQEGFHATTYEHIEKVKKIFPILHAREYSPLFAQFRKVLREKSPDAEIEKTLEAAEELLRRHKPVINKYCDYLTHTDFVPHNFRIRENKIYMLDCSPEVRTVHFGNKYEGWARFVNYMTIHNPTLNKLLFKYILDNRGEEEYLNLRLMRIYKIGFILNFYAESLASTKGDLRTLTLERMDFWHKILQYMLDDKKIPDDFVEKYKTKRDKLRSEDEKSRQREFALA